MKNAITRLFEDINLYEEKDFNFYSKSDDSYSIIKQSDLLAIFDYLGLNSNEKLITDCQLCGGHFPFSFETKAFYFDEEIYSLAIGENFQGQDVYLNLQEFTPINAKIKTDSIKTKFVTIDYYFCCSNNNKHHYFMKVLVIFDLEKVKILKIGQFPEKSSLGNFNAEIYKKQLRKLNDSYIDYKCSEKSFKHGLYAGAYDYLRRVFEKMINYYISVSGIEMPSNARESDKINPIKDYFDKRIQEFLNPLYKALSAGVHTMSEEDCRENYFDLKTIIDIQLQFIKSEEDLQLEIDKSKSVLSSLQGKYGKK